MSAFIGASGSRDKPPAPNPLINITVHPPHRAILKREWPLYLPCSAIFAGTANDYNYDESDVDERGGDDDIDDGNDDVSGGGSDGDAGSLEMGNGDFTKRDKMRDTHFTDLRSDVNLVSNEFGAGNELHKRELLSAAEHRKPTITYQWLRNDELIHSNNETRIFVNGTLRLTYSSTASGSYRCMAKTSVAGGGVVLSTATHVQQAGKFIFQIIFNNNNQTTDS